MEMKETLKKMRDWFPQEPSLETIRRVNSPATNIPRKKITQSHIAIANGLLLGAFLGTHLLIDPYNRSLIVEIGYWSTFVPATILLNYLLYWYSKNQTNPKCHELFELNR